MAREQMIGYGVFVIHYTLAITDKLSEKSLQGTIDVANTDHIRCSVYYYMKTFLLEKSQMI